MHWSEDDAQVSVGKMWSHALPDYNRSGPLHEKSKGRGHGTGLRESWIASNASGYNHRRYLCPMEQACHDTLGVPDEEVHELSGVPGAS